MEINVKGLDGNSAKVSISPDGTVEDLKSLLRESFLPAKNSQIFHLFLKGVKLSIDFPLKNLSMGYDEFIVLVPFTKKQGSMVHTNSISTHPEDHRSTSWNQQSPQLNETDAQVSFANAAWSDMMNDLSSLSEISREMEPGLGLKRGSAALGKISSGKMDLLSSCCQEDKCSDAISSNSQRKKRSLSDGWELSIEKIHHILCTNSSEVLNKQCCELLDTILGSVNCLSNAKTGYCLLAQEFSGVSSWGINFCETEAQNIDPSLDERKLCLCPSWLKKILKSFTFLNIVSGFLQRHHAEITWNNLRGAMEQLNGLGAEKVGMEDLELLPVLCPKIIMLGNQETGARKSGIAIFILDTSMEVENCESKHGSRAAGKQLSTKAIVNAIKGRKNLFETHLQGAIKYFKGKKMFVNGSPALFSLENLLVSMKVGSSTVPMGSKVTRARTRSMALNSQSGWALCQDTTPLLPMEMVEHLREGIGSDGQMIHVKEIGARTAVHVELPNDLLATTKAALEGMGVSRLYSHQAEAIQCLLSGKNVVVATSTSSGKSLCYNLPVLDSLLRDLLSCALYLFPTKALAQDQLRALLDMTGGLDISLNVGVYDGDTSQADRTWLRDNARLLITNPDMLHMSILPFHRQFQRILSNLRFVVIDEAHAYQGAFGCHTALILRRLRRICCHVYGSDPSFILCTATAANPREHAMELANLQTLELIQNDGSPCGPKLFLLWNPPFCFKNASKTPTSINESKAPYTDVIAKRSSPILEASRLFAEMVQHGLRCIAFCKTRKLSELVLCYTRELLQENAPDLVDSICVYRAGYTAKDRRRIESDFFGGKLRGVAATNALELGIDVGHIDATLHLGFPGSVSSLWQQAGRSGRRERPSLAVYIAFDSPLDQYFMKFPQKLFGRPIEHCQVDACNQQVLEQHVACAALEHPLSLLYDEKYFGSGLCTAVTTLINKGYLGADPSLAAPSKMWNYIGQEKKPSHAISIRAIETEKYRVINQIKDELLEEIEESKAFFQVYDGAVYMHQGRTFLVKNLDLCAKVALCQEADLKYYTKTRDYTDIHVVGGELAYPTKESKMQCCSTTAQANICKVTTTWFGFHRIWRGSNQIFDTVDLSLPRYSYESQAVWIRVPQSIKPELEAQEFSFRAGLHAASHALLNVVPLYIMCNSSDLGSECANPHETRNFPERLLLYDRHPGGIGLSAQVLPLFRELLTAAMELLTTCLCLGVTGCPNCVQTLSCKEYNEVLDKSAAILILKGVVEAENSYLKRDLSKASGVECQSNV